MNNDFFYATDSTVDGEFVNRSPSCSMSGGHNPIARDEHAAMHLFRKESRRVLRNPPFASKSAGNAFFDRGRGCVVADAEVIRLRRDKIGSAETRRFDNFCVVRHPPKVDVSMKKRFAALS